MDKTIMIVDDSEVFVSIVNKLLIREGYDTVVARTGEECLEKIEDYEPNLVILDNILPGINGVDVLRKLRENPKTQDVRVVFLTVTDFLSEEGIKTLKELKVKDYIQKPFSYEDLIVRVKTLLGD